MSCLSSGSSFLFEDLFTSVDDTSMKNVFVPVHSLSVVSYIVLYDIALSKCVICSKNGGTKYASSKINRLVAVHDIAKNQCNEDAIQSLGHNVLAHTCFLN